MSTTARLTPQQVITTHVHFTQQVHALDQYYGHHFLHAVYYCATALRHDYAYYDAESLQSKPWDETFSYRITYLKDILPSYIAEARFHYKIIAEANLQFSSTPIAGELLSYLDQMDTVNTNDYGYSSGHQPDMTPAPSEELLLTSKECMLMDLVNDAIGLQDLLKEQFIDDLNRLQTAVRQYYPVSTARQLFDTHIQSVKSNVQGMQCYNLNQDFSALPSAFDFFSPIYKDLEVLSGAVASTTRTQEQQAHPGTYLCYSSQGSMLRYTGSGTCLVNHVTYQSLDPFVLPVDEYFATLKAIPAFHDEL